MLYAASNNIVSRCVLGRKCDDSGGGGNFGVLGKKILRLFSAFCFGDFFPSLSWVSDGFDSGIDTTKKKKRTNHGLK